jgi:hypothetical protein
MELDLPGLYCREEERVALPNGKLVEEETNVDVVFKHLNDS